MAYPTLYRPLDVIRYSMGAGLSVTAIIVERTPQGAVLMFEDGTHGVERAHYTIGGLSRFAVIG